MLAADTWRYRCGSGQSSEAPACCQRVSSASEGIVQRRLGIGGGRCAARRIAFAKEAGEKSFQSRRVSVEPSA